MEQLVQMLIDTVSKGAILAVGNHLPPNIPPEMLDLYFEYLLPRLKRH